jgi:hypothetical protein
MFIGFSGSRSEISISDQGIDAVGKISHACCASSSGLDSAFKCGTSREGMSRALINRTCGLELLSMGDAAELVAFNTVSKHPRAEKMLCG